MCNDAQQCAILLEVLDFAERLPEWTVHISDSTFEMEQTLFEAAERAKKHQLQKAAGTLNEMSDHGQALKTTTVYHSLFFVHH